MPDTENSKLIVSPWRVVEVFVLYLLASTVGEFMGAAMGEGSQLNLAVIEFGLALVLSWPALTGKRWGYIAMGIYLIYYGLCTFWLLMRGAEAFTWAYVGPLSAYFAAGGLKMLFTKPETSEKPLE